MWVKFAANFWPISIAAFWMLIYTATGTSILAWLWSRLEILYYRAFAPHAAPVYVRNSAGLGIKLIWLGIAGILFVLVLVWFIFGGANYWKEVGNVLNGSTNTHDLLLIVKSCAALVFCMGMWLYLTAESRPSAG